MFLCICTSYAVNEITKCKVISNNTPLDEHTIVFSVSKDLTKRPDTPGYHVVKFIGNEVSVPSKNISVEYANLIKTENFMTGITIENITIGTPPMSFRLELTNWNTTGMVHDTFGSKSSPLNIKYLDKKNYEWHATLEFKDIAGRCNISPTVRCKTGPETDDNGEWVERQILVKDLFAAYKTKCLDP